VEFEEKNFEMSRTVIEKLIDRGDLRNEDDALQQIQNHEWVVQAGYGHIAHVLSSDIGVRACRSVFAERKGG